MDLWTHNILPTVLLIARITAFFGVLPIFGWSPLPMIVRAGIALWVSLFYAFTMSLPPVTGETGYFALGLVIGQEIIIGLGLGLAANLVYLAVQQGGKIISQEMGLTDASVIDPTSGEETEALSMFFEVTFMVLFLTAGGHHMLMMLIGRSYDVFPLAQAPDISRLAEAVLTTCGQMLVFALKLSAPLLAAFLILTVALAVVSKALPETNVLFLSFPLRIGLGLLIAAALMPSLSAFTDELQRWLGEFLAV